MSKSSGAEAQRSPVTLSLRLMVIAPAATCGMTAAAATGCGVTTAARMGVGGVTVASIPSAPSFNPTAVSRPGTTAVASSPAASGNDATGRGEQQAGEY